MKAIKNKSDFGVLFKRNVLTVVKIVSVFTVVVVVAVFLFLKDNKGLKYGVPTGTQSDIVYKDGLTFPQTKEDKNNKIEIDETQLTGNVQNNQGNTPELDNPSDSGSALPDVTGWSTAQIVSKAKDAVNKTKAYKANLTVEHTESFSADVTECSAGGIIRSIVDLMIGWVVKPVEETLVYQNGKAVNSEGETVPIILPKKNEFTLTESGVKSASVQRMGSEYVIKINLVEESVGMYDVPKHNAASIGYLDVANFDISFMEVDSADIVYKGSSIELRINADGYVTYAKYKIPLRIDGAAHKGSISGSATFEGEQTEEWRLSY